MVSILLLKLFIVYLRDIGHYNCVTKSPSCLFTLLIDRTLSETIVDRSIAFLFMVSYVSKYFVESLVLFCNSLVSYSKRSL